MIWLRRFVYWLIKGWTTRFAANHLKRKGMLAYLRTLQAVRKSLMAAILFVCILQLMIIGVVGSFVTAVLLTDQEPASKLWILLAGFLFVSVLPIIALIVVFSEKFWFKVSGAQKFFEEDISDNTIPSGDTAKSAVT